ncbi:16860_t:CDS:2 [Entrophospora sp. SA101]|nr:16860_t:CDS:2 [Entrophospora sp. SA101]
MRNIISKKYLLIALRERLRWSGIFLEEQVPVKDWFDSRLNTNMKLFERAYSEATPVA